MATRWLRLGEATLFLALLAFGVVQAARAGAGWTTFALASLLLIVFGVASSRQRTLPAGVLTALLLAALALHAELIVSSRGFLWLAFPLWMLAGRVLPLGVGLLSTATSLAAVITVLRLDGDSSSAGTLGPIVGGLVAVGLARGVLRLEREAAEQRRLLDEVLRAQAEATALADDLARTQREAGVLAERARLAHDIHDTLAQGFSSIVLLARAAQRQGEADAVRHLVGQIEATAAENLTEARRVVYAIAPQEDILETALRRLADQTAAVMGAEVLVDVDPEPGTLPMPVEVTLLRAAQSALANVRQHSKATHVQVTLARSDDEIRLDVVDDGVGFDTQAVPALPTLDGGYGLRAMRERLAELGGGLDVESEPGGGTALSVHIPVGGTR